MKTGFIGAVGHHRWAILTGVALLVLTAVLYLLQVALFDSPRDTFFYLLQDLAFLPVQVLLVTILLSRLLAVREKRAMLRKMNMVIGAFFSDTGNGLLPRLMTFDADAERLGAGLRGLGSLDDRGFAKKGAEVAGAQPEVDAHRGDLAALRTYLLARREFLLRLLENPILLEHEAFTDLLWAVSHLTDELDSRPALEALPENDLKHLAGDISRAYTRLVLVWLAYLRHLRTDYPYLFSLAARMNPFDPAARVVLD